MLRSEAGYHASHDFLPAPAGGTLLPAYDRRYSSSPVSVFCIYLLDDGFEGGVLHRCFWCVGLFLLSLYLLPVWSCLLACIASGAIRSLFCPPGAMRGCGTAFRGCSVLQDGCWGRFVCFARALAPARALVALVGSMYSRGWSGEGRGNWLVGGARPRRWSFLLWSSGLPDPVFLQWPVFRGRFVVWRGWASAESWAGGAGRLRCPGSGGQRDPGSRVALALGSSDLISGGRSLLLPFSFFSPLHLSSLLLLLSFLVLMLDWARSCWVPGASRSATSRLDSGCRSRLDRRSGAAVLALSSAGSGGRSVSGRMGRARWPRGVGWVLREFACMGTGSRCLQVRSFLSYGAFPGRGEFPGVVAWGRRACVLRVHARYTPQRGRGWRVS